MQTTFSKISNLIFEYFIVFAIIFLWLNFYFTNIFIVCTISIISTIIIMIIAKSIRKKKNIKSQLTINENKKIKEISLNFLLSDNNKILTFYNILLSSRHDCRIEKNSIKWDDTVFIPNYSKQELNKDDIASIVRQNNMSECIIIAGIAFNDNAYSLVNTLARKIILLNECDTFFLMKDRDFYPEIIVRTKSEGKFKYKDLKNIAFVKKNAKHYLFSGVIILITSFFIKYNIYYTIFATLLFIFSAISFFNKQQTQDSNIDI